MDKKAMEERCVSFKINKKYTPDEKEHQIHPLAYLSLIRALDGDFEEKTYNAGQWIMDETVTVDDEEETMPEINEWLFYRPDLDLAMFHEFSIVTTYHKRTFFYTDICNVDGFEKTKLGQLLSSTNLSSIDFQMLHSYLYMDVRMSYNDDKYALCLGVVINPRVEVDVKYIYCSACGFAHEISYQLAY